MDQIPRANRERNSQFDRLADSQSAARRAERFPPPTKGLPYFKLYSRDFRDGVRALSLEEIGAYTIILTLIYDAGGPIIDDGETIRRQLGCDKRVWARVRKRLAESGKLCFQDGLISNHRADVELSEQARLSAVRAVSGQRGGRARGGENTKFGASSAQVDDKSAISRPDFSKKPPPNHLISNDSPQAIARNQNQNHIEEYSAQTCARDQDQNPIGAFEVLPPVAVSRSTPLAPTESQLARCVAASGPGLADPAKTPSLHLTAPRIAAALAAGCDLELDVIRVVAAKTMQPRANPITSWAYFEAAWADARNTRLRGFDPAPETPTNVTIYGANNDQNQKWNPNARRTPAQQRAIRQAAGIAVLRELGHVGPVAF